LQLENVVLAKDKELLAKDLEVSTKELLRANGLLTSRGMFEWLLKKAFYELNTKGKFNASEMIKNILSSTITPSIELMMEGAMVDDRMFFIISDALNLPGLQLIESLLEQPLKHSRAREKTVRSE